MELDGYALRWDEIDEDITVPGVAGIGAKPLSVIPRARPEEGSFATSIRERLYDDIF
jgi:hypothetical protein